MRDELRRWADVGWMVFAWLIGVLIGFRFAPLLFPTDVLMQIGIALVSGVGALALWERFTASGRRIADLRAARRQHQ